MAPYCQTTATHIIAIPTNTMGITTTATIATQPNTTYLAITTRHYYGAYYYCPAIRTCR